MTSEHEALSFPGARLSTLGESELDAAFRFYGRVTSDLITVFDGEGRILFSNGACERVFSAPPEVCLGTILFDFVHPEERAAVRAAFERWSATKGDALFLVETRIVCRVGQLRHLHWTVAPYRVGHGGATFYVCCARDVTPQIRAAERLRRSETRHRMLMAGALDPMVTIDPLGKVIEASRSVETVFGYRTEELIGQNIKVLMVDPHASAHDGYLEHYRRTGQTGILGRTRQFDVRRKDGTVIQCELSVSRIDIPGEPEPLFVGSFRDVSDRCRAEVALGESEARMRAIFDQEFQFVGLLARDGTVLEINHSALRSVGSMREDVVGMPFWDTAWWRSVPERREKLRHAVRAAAGGEFVRFEVAFEDDEGNQRWIDFSLKPVRAADGEVLFLLPEGRDITRFKSAHARELAMNDALAQIGESASLLAHEIKNPITAVNLALRAVGEKLGEDQKAVVEDLSGRLSKLERTMRRTLSFARPLKLERVPCDMAGFLEELAREVGPELEAGRIELVLEVPPGLPQVSVDTGLLEEVLLNLVRNAREALAGGGRLRLSAAREGKGNLLVTVEDDGPGIPPEVREGLFKPFVTSKPGGTGLGLAIARKIVREHGGEIDVRPSEMGGVCFWIRLPTSRPARPRT